jgi:diguanylate cyclase (GGDEF)-like protein
MIAVAIAGHAIIQHDAARMAGSEHVALRLALDELHVTPGDTSRFDDAQLQQLAARAGLRDLRFEAEPIVAAGRDVQSLDDAQGRIVGWLTWRSDRALIDAMARLWNLVAAGSAALSLCALLAVFIVWRLRRSLAHAKKTMRQLNSEDALTGLPNHRVMSAKLDDALERRRDGFVALMIIDLDGFREVNDTLGRTGGDAVLAQLAARLQSALPAGAELGRFEDGEFAVVVAGTEAAAAPALADTLRGLLARPIVMEQMWQISAGIGVAQAPEDGTSGEELSRRAGLALRAAKRAGRATVRRFEPQIETEDCERRSLRRELETAIAAKALDVHYQPVVAAAGGGIIGVEALARWTHPTRGAIAPSVFIPLAEQSGLMLQLGELVLRRALADGARWPSLSIAVNLSPLQIRDRNLVDLVGEVMRQCGIAASRVVLEVTESILIENPQEALIRLEALRALGVNIALDDFGTGYSSLSYLQKFPFGQIKIDRAFVSSLGTVGHAGAIIQAIVTLGHALGLHVLAEGVETDEQRVLLRLAGCDEMQGFLFAKPLPAAAIDKVLARPAADRKIRRKVAGGAG